MSNFPYSEKTKDIIKRYLLFLIGLFIASMGVASVPYSISLVNDWFSFWGWLNLLSVLQIVVQVLLLRRKCKPVEILLLQLQLEV